jgi:uncharacterized protein (TIGR01777 family)
MKIAVTGATGLIGSALVEQLRNNDHSIVRIVRRDPGPDDVSWDPPNGRLDASQLEGVDAVVHLAGAGIGDHRWTDEYKRQIRDSRVITTDLLARTLATMERKPAVLLSGSAVGWYGDRGDEELDESSAPGTGFLADVCRSWEAATAPAEEAGIRVAHLRTGIVLSSRADALKKQLPLFKLGLGGKFGNGRQWQSWISIDDEVGAISHLLTADVSGPVNLTAPEPVRNSEFGRILGRVLHRPALLPIPKFGPALLLGGELAQTLLFEGQKVTPGVLTSTGYSFLHPTLEGALRAVLDK